MAAKHEWFPTWNTAVREALHNGVEGSPGPAAPGVFDAVFDAVGALLEDRGEIGVGIDRWEGLRIEGNRLSFTRPITVRQQALDGRCGPMVAEVFGRYHDDNGCRGGCLFLRAADWNAFVVTEEDRVCVLLRSGSDDRLLRATLTHEVRQNPRVRTCAEQLPPCATLEGGPVVLLYERREQPRWIRVGTDGPGCTIDLRETFAFRETAGLLIDIVRGKRPARDFLRGGLPLFGGDVSGTLVDTGDRRAVLCLALVMRSMVWRSESSG